MSAFYEFTKNYGKKLHEVVEKLKRIEEKYSSKLDEKEEEVDKIYEKLSKMYDRYLVDAVMNITAETDEESLVRTAMNNYDRTGTEPQFIIIAAEDYYRDVCNLLGVNEEEEDE